MSGKTVQEDRFSPCTYRYVVPCALLLNITSPDVRSPTGSSSTPSTASTIMTLAGSPSFGSKPFTRCSRCLSEITYTGGICPLIVLAIRMCCRVRSLCICGALRSCLRPSILCVISLMKFSGRQNAVFPSALWTPLSTCHSFTVSEVCES